MSVDVITGFTVISQASEQLHKMHTLQLSRKYVLSVTPERKAQVGLVQYILLLYLLSHYIDQGILLKSTKIAGTGWMDFWWCVTYLPHWVFVCVSQRLLQHLL